MNCKYLFTYMAVLLSAVWSAAAVPFQYDLYVSSSRFPSLSFGIADQAEQHPAPPFSGMFSLTDLHLLNTAPDPARWFDRLCTDLKTSDSAATQGWVLYSSGSCSLQFKLKSGTAPADLSIAYEKKPGQAASAVEETITDGYTLRLKSGQCYLIYLKDSTHPIPPRPALDNVVLISSHENPPRRNVAIASGLRQLIINITAGLSRIAFPGEANASAADWILEIQRPGYSVSYQWLTENSRLQITFTPGRRNSPADSFSICMHPQKNSVSPVNTIVELPAADHSSPVIADNADWIIPVFCSLDFDGNGIINLNDAMYLYNFIETSFGDKDPYFTSSELRYYTSKAGAGELQTALENMQNYLPYLNFDEKPADAAPDLNDAMYLYNYIQAGFGENDPAFSSSQLKKYTHGTSAADLDKALENLKTLYENSKN